jgi:type I restriction enzyme R subunit
MSSFLSESDVEEIALDILKSANGFEYVNGYRLEPGKESGRGAFSEGVLADRLRVAIERINPDLNAVAIDSVVRKVVAHEFADLVSNNQRFHRFLVEGVPYEYRDGHGNQRTKYAYLLDFEEPENNDFLSVNQFTVKEHKRSRIPDVVLFVNGMPLGLIEFKDPTDEDATIESAYNQLQTYKDEIPNFCAYNEFMVISDGVEARLGTITSEFSRFQPWKAVGETDEGEPEFFTLAKGVFDKFRLLDILRYFILFESDGITVSKKIAAYHQYRATNKAIVSTIEATAKEGERRIGVVWHTQGSGKSLTMVFYAGKVVQQAELANPTLVVITDRNDLDGQLHEQFARCKDVLRQKPEQAKDRDHLKTLLGVASGGIVFTTIQKFFPEEKGGKYPALTDRRNVIVIADEAHRSQYDMIDGFARHMRDALPNASFVGFTGTPIEADDRNTRQVFGEYIDVYDIEQAVKDGATVPIYYETRIARLNLDEAEIPHIDPEFEEIMEGEEEVRIRKTASKWSSIEALVGSGHRIEEVSRDLVTHFENRCNALDGKGMVVAMSRRIAVDMYDAIAGLRPHWISDDDAKGSLKVVFSGAATDGPEWQKHIRSKQKMKEIERRFKDPSDSLKLVIVCDMWLTGFDVPSLHTLYMDKPMRRHSLMQAIARVNRVFKDKPGGLVVDYLGLADELKKALATYTNSGGHGQPLLDEAEADAVLQTKCEVVRDMYHGFAYAHLLTVSPAEKIAGLLKAADFILGLEDGKERYLANTSALMRAFALASTSDYGLSIRDDIGFFEAVRARIAKTRGQTAKSNAEMDSAIKQLVAQAVASDGIVDILSEAGINRPDISILSDEFLAEVRGLPYRNLAREMLERLLRQEIRRKAAKNAVAAKKFSEMLQEALQKYRNNAIETTQLIAMLIEVAKELKADDIRNSELGLTEDEIAFYDALAQSKSALDVLGDKQLRIIASELVKSVRQNVTLDWTLRETAKANIRRIVKRILNQYGYPPDAQAKAVETVLEQAELLCREEAA